MGFGIQQHDAIGIFPGFTVQAADNARHGFLSGFQTEDSDLLVRRKVLRQSDASAVLADDLRPAIAQEDIAKKVGPGNLDGQC
jgi:hypothetical protein